ncbi:MAG: RNA polymerase sigma factor RpoE [Acidobacteria bacterium]|nr:MAG: RNA polymerase sigma factor RpoE [Acidobacteriota bacterium]
MPPSAPAALADPDDDAAEAPRSRLREDDRETVAACQRGDRQAFDRLVGKYQRDVYRLCYRYVFLKAYRALGRFRGDSSFSTWLYRIAVNTCLNFRASRRPEAAELPEALPDKRPGALEGIERDERSRRVREAVTRLPEKQRATLILKVYHDLTHEEVAGILGSSVGTVKANLFHALGNLRKMLAAEAGE